MASAAMTTTTRKRGGGTTMMQGYNSPKKVNQFESQINLTIQILYVQ